MAKIYGMACLSHTGKAGPVKWDSAYIQESVFVKKQVKYKEADTLYTWAQACGLVGGEPAMKKAIKRGDVQPRKVKTQSGQEKTMFALFTIEGLSDLQNICVTATLNFC